MKKLITIICSLCLVLSLAACGNTNSTPDASQTPAAPGEEEIAVITIKDYGTVEVELNRAAAPITVENFVKLVNEGFYDGLSFHRIIPGFMIQGGDPLGNGTGGSEESIKGEFSKNGVKNPIEHVRGTISMARAADPDSASSQFFIVHEDSTFLDGQYAGFGTVISGMEAVDAICESAVAIDNNGSIAAENQPIIESIVIK